MAGDLAKTTDMPEQVSNGNASTEATSKPKKKSLYQRYVDAKRGRNVQISEEDMLKYTGKTKAELQDWAKDRPGVAGNQAAGTLAMGPASGLGGAAASEGFGGWGPDAAGKLKFPPKPQENKKANNLDAEDD
ncbi:hypothetical protein NEMBOFW57_008720 [Staphylotrichum longicolle]|uniref:Uncharacterized protein n=1 Tax=Staphylotrichum longicolle TaxID=669026 RepID=A0AAD4HXG8_9PEZI|nr:hypothetical protein NEMBOFW57_008720 [Staphylotrichum longicolle]